MPAMSPADPRYAGLYRSCDQRIILGVCAGLAHKLNMPLLAVRAAVVALLPLLMGWAYFLGVFLPALPTTGRDSTAGQSTESDGQSPQDTGPLGRVDEAAAGVRLRDGV
jgi:phage shock protein PspC (stress-responsive transcriptional regulator)